MAAEMLARLGFECSVTDLYGDVDTHEICEGRVKKLSQLNDLETHESFVRAHDFAIFTGGLEGSENLAGKLALWTKAAFASKKSLLELSNMANLNEAMALAGVDRYPFFQDLQTIDGGQFVYKNPRQSGTARPIFSGDLHDGLPKGFVVQRIVKGTSVSLIFVAENESVECLGGSRQIFDSKNPYAWVGSVSNLELSLHEMEAATGFAIALSNLVSFRGVFGIDFIVNKDGIWPVDVNPRIPASAEIVGDYVMQRHLNAFGIDCLPPAEPSESITIKRVLFNRSPKVIHFDQNYVNQFAVRFSSLSSPTSIADVPCHGEVIDPEHPILTVFATGTNLSEADAEMEKSKSKILAALFLENG